MNIGYVQNTDEELGNAQNTDEELGMYEYWICAEY